MSQIITLPVVSYYDRNGEPLEAGKIYIGEAGANPETNPVNVYTDRELTTQVAQPVRTLAGRAALNGKYVNLYTNSRYSITVRNKNDEIVDTDLDSESYNPIVGTALSRTTEAFESFLSIEDGFVVTIAGLEYVRDSTVSLANSAAFDLGVAGFNAFGVVFAEHFGAVGDGITLDDAAINRALAQNKVVNLKSNEYATNDTILLDLEGNRLIGTGSNSNDARTRILPNHTSGAVVWLRKRSTWFHGIEISSQTDRANNGDASAIDIRVEPEDAPFKFLSRFSIFDCLLINSPSHGFVLSGGGGELGTINRVTIQDADGHGFIYDDGTTLGRTNRDINAFYVTTEYSRAIQCKGNVLIGVVGDNGLPAGLTFNHFQALGCAYDTDVKVSDYQIVDRGRQTVWLQPDIEDQQYADATTAAGKAKPVLSEPAKGIEIYSSDGVLIQRPYMSSLSAFIRIDATCQGAEIINPIMFKGSNTVTHDNGVIIEQGATGCKVTATTALIDAITTPSQLAVCDEATSDITIDGVKYFAGRGLATTFPLDNTFRDSQIGGGAIDVPSSRRITVLERDGQSAGTDSLTRFKSSSVYDGFKATLKAEAGLTLTINDGSTVSGDNKPFLLGGENIVISGDTEVTVIYNHILQSWVLEKVVGTNGARYSVDKMTLVANATGETTANLQTTVNAILTQLKASGFMKGS